MALDCDGWHHGTVMGAPALQQRDQWFESQRWPLVTSLCLFRSVPSNILDLFNCLLLTCLILMTAGCDPSGGMKLWCVDVELRWQLLQISDTSGRDMLTVKVFQTLFHTTVFLIRLDHNYPRDTQIKSCECERTSLFPSALSLFLCLIHPYSLPFWSVSDDWFRKQQWQHIHTHTRTHTLTQLLWLSALGWETAHVIQRRTLDYRSLNSASDNTNAQHCSTVKTRLASVNVRNGPLIVFLKRKVFTVVYISTDCQWSGFVTFNNSFCFL